MQIYKPNAEGNGYFYHVRIYQEALLTYKQQLERKHRERVSTTDPDDTTDYDAMDWYKTEETSFAEKEWEDLVTRIRNHFKMKGNIIYQTERDEHYAYFTGSVIFLKGSFMLRERIWIYHSSTIQFDEQRFMTDLTRIGRWEK
ncbi:hypothetical protein [Paenibacillus sp. GCM10027626]|uniref:hypothetical protein n=1 Tax=Paenibacillus sp. GCM10027626 TaxID=3273411 RepID=UPI00363166FD